MEHKMIDAATVRALCGGISDMSLWRWLAHPDMHFPQPVVIQRRRYWRESEIIAWIERQPRAGQAA